MTVMTFEGTFYYQMILRSVLPKYNSMKICYYLQNQLDCLTCMQAFLNGILLGQLTHVAMSHGYRHTFVPIVAMSYGSHLSNTYLLGHLEGFRTKEKAILCQLLIMELIEKS